VTDKTTTENYQHSKHIGVVNNINTILLLLMLLLLFS